MKEVISFYHVADFLREDPNPSPLMNSEQQRHVMCCLMNQAISMKLVAVNAMRGCVIIDVTCEVCRIRKLSYNRVMSS